MRLSLSDSRRDHNKLLLALTDSMNKSGNWNQSEAKIDEKRKATIARAMVAFFKIEVPTLKP